MITFIARLHVPPENALAFEELMTYVAAMTNEHEPGVAYYAFAKSVDEADTYVLVEVYRVPGRCLAYGNRLGQGVASQIPAPDRGQAPHHAICQPRHLTCCPAAEGELT